eukprot:SAG31_NODE_33136_length_347_cov_1.016129_1_plen_29_part_10
MLTPAELRQLPCLKDLSGASDSVAQHSEL